MHCRAMDSFDFKAIPSLNKMMVMDLTRCEWIGRRENVIVLGPSGSGKTHAALGLGLVACQKGLPVAFVTAAALVIELMEARDEKRLLRRHPSHDQRPTVTLHLGRSLTKRRGISQS